jgi:flagellar biosynthetic protein FliR
MPGNAVIPAGLLFSFLLALARVSGVVAFLPLPGVRNAPDMTRIALALSMTFCLYSSWPPPPATDPGMVTLMMWVISETSFGLLLGLVVSVVVESFQLATQIIGLQAGFSYASTVDPNSQADTTILQVVAQLLASCLFFTLGLHRDLLALMGRSFETVRPGTFVPGSAALDPVIRFTGAIFSTGLRIAFPLVALLLLVDVALALLSRIQAQLQLISMAFPAKMLAGIGFFAFTLWAAPAVAETAFRKALAAAAALVVR